MNLEKLLPAQINVDPSEMLSSEFLRYYYNKKEDILYLKLLNDEEFVVFLEGETELSFDDQKMLNFGLELFFHEGSLFIDYKAQISAGKVIYLSSFVEDVGLYDKEDGCIASGNLAENPPNKIMDKVLDMLAMYTEGEFTGLDIEGPVKWKIKEISNKEISKEETVKIIDRSKYFNFFKNGYLN